VLDAYLARHPEISGTIPTILVPKLRTINQTLDTYFASNPEQNVSSPGLPPHIQENITVRAETLDALNKTYKEAFAACPVPPASTVPGAQCIRQLSPNHAFWVQVQPLLAAGRDDEAEALVRKAVDPDHVTEVLPLNNATVASNEAPCERDTKGFCKMPLKAIGIQHEVYDAHLLRNIPVAEMGPAAFENQREFNHQMDAQLKILFYSMITGMMVAPFVFAGGAILRRAFVPSDTVGFKAYPSKSAGFFLLLGAFGIFAIPFGAWALRDLHKRSIEGQIAL
jgi:hypothetical protein